MFLRSAIAALMLCTLMLAGPALAQSERKVIGPLQISPPPVARGPVQIELPAFATADTGTANRVVTVAPGRITRVPGTLPAAPARSAVPTAPVLQPAPVSPAISASPGLSPVNPAGTAAVPARPAAPGTSALQPAPARAGFAASPGVSPVNPRSNPPSAAPAAVRPQPAPSATTQATRTAAQTATQTAAPRPTATPAAVEVEERPRNAVAVYVGRSATTNFTSIIYQPWLTEFEDTALIAVSYNRRLFTVIDHLDIEAEFNIAKRFGEADEWEINTGILLRWTWFPWNDYVKTTLGISIFGPSYATGISDTEKQKSGNDTGNRFLNFFAPELTFADPDNPDVEFIFRLHHRSGIFGIYEGVDGGSTFISSGLRYRF